MVGLPLCIINTHLIITYNCIPWSHSELAQSPGSLSHEKRRLGNENPTQPPEQFTRYIPLFGINVLQDGASSVYHAYWCMWLHSGAEVSEELCILKSNTGRRAGKDRKGQIHNRSKHTNPHPRDGNQSPSPWHGNEASSSFPSSSSSSCVGVGVISCLVVVVASNAGEIARSHRSAAEQLNEPQRAASESWAIFTRRAHSFRLQVEVFS